MSLSSLRKTAKNSLKKFGNILSSSRGTRKSRSTPEVVSSKVVSPLFSSAKQLGGNPILSAFLSPPDQPAETEPMAEPMAKPMA